MKKYMCVECKEFFNQEEINEVYLGSFPNYLCSADLEAFIQKVKNAVSQSLNSSEVNN